MKLIRNWILVVLLGPVALAGAAQTLSPINKLNLVDAGAQINPGVGTFSNGNFVVVYEDRAAADGSDSGIFGSIYDSNMELVQDCGVVNTKTASFQTFPHVAVAPNDNFMVVWSNFTNTFGQLFSSTCQRLGEEKFLGATFNGLDVGSDSQGNFWVVRSINGKAYLNKYSNEGTVLLQDIIVQDYASPVRPERTVLAVLSDDSVLVTWYNVNEVGSSDIFGAIVNADGTIASEAFLINSTTMNNQISPFVADLSAGGFIAVWMSDTGSGSSEIRGRLFSSDGTAGDEFAISPSDLNSQLTPYVISRSSGGFSVGWTDQADPQHVYLASYDATNTEIGGRVALSSDEALMLTVNDEVELAELADGSVIGVWAGNGIGNWDIYGRVVRASADPFWELSPLTKVNTGVAGEQVRPSVDALPDGNFFVAYEDRAGADGGVSGIFGAVYNSDMQLVHDCGVLNATTNSYQEFPHVAVAPNGVSMVIWRNFTNTFGQRFSPSCERLGEETFLGATFNGHDVVSDSEGNFWVARSINGKGYLNKYSNDGVLLLQNIIYQSYTLPELPGRVRLAAMADGRVMITWYNVGGAEASKVYGVFVDADGTVSGDSFPLSADTNSAQNGVVVEAFSDGGFVAIWGSEVSPGVSQIMGRVFSADGTGGEEFVVSAVEGVTQSTPFVEARRDGGFTVAWTNNSTPSQVDLATFSAEGVQMGRRIAFSADESVTITGDGDVELAELSDGSLVGVWMASNDIYGRRIVGVAPVLPPDFDEDGIPDSLDPDDDNDGVEDEQDAFPFDRQESADTDSDGIGNNADTDDDNDGVVDSADAYPNDPLRTIDQGDKKIGLRATARQDTDRDGIPDFEEQVLGVRAEQKAWQWHSDKDGFTDLLEYLAGSDPTSSESIPGASDSAPPTYESPLSLLGSQGLRASIQRGGRRVAIAGDLAVSAPGNGTNRVSDPLKLHIYRKGQDFRGNVSWEEQQVITSQDIETWGNFGSSVAISPQSEIVVLDDQRERISVYTENNGTWGLASQSDSRIRDIRYKNGGRISGANGLIDANLDDPARHASISISGASARGDASFRIEPEDPLERGWVTSVAIDGDFAAAGDPLRDIGALERAGAVHTYHYTNNQWIALPVLTSPEPKSFEFFGTSIDIDGDRLIVGAPFTHEDYFGHSNWQKGRVYVYRFAVDHWELEAVLKDQTSIDYSVGNFLVADSKLDGFGYSVALDGEYASVGAPLKSVVSIADNSYVERAGSAFLFKRIGQAWRAVGEFNERPVTGGYQGFSVDLRDGAMISAASAEVAGNRSPLPVGFETDYKWAQIIVLDSDGDSIDFYEDLDDGSASALKDHDRDGISDDLDIDADGDGVSNDIDSFPLNPDLSSDVDADLIDDQHDPDSDNDGLSDSYETEFGLDPFSGDDAQADLDEDGFSNLIEFLSVSDPSDSASLPQASHSSLIPNYARIGQDFGHAISVHEHFAIVGAPNDPGSNGAAYFFVKSTQNSWELKEVILPDVEHSPSEFYHFGFDVAASAQFLAISWPGYDGARGSVWLYEIRVDGAVLHQVLIGKTAGAQFGRSVEFEGHTLIVGSPRANGDTPSVGSVAIYKMSTGNRWIESDYIAPPGQEVLADFGARLAPSLHSLIVGEPSAKLGKGRLTFFNFSEGDETWSSDLIVEGVINTDKVGDVFALKGDWAAAAVSDRYVQLYRKKDNAWSDFGRLQKEGYFVEDPPVDIRICADCSIKMDDGLIFVGESAGRVGLYQLDGFEWIYLGFVNADPTYFEVEDGLIFSRNYGEATHMFADDIVSVTPYDADGDGDTVFVDPDDSDATVFRDYDGDGISDLYDLDDDNDGVLDAEDAFSLNSYEVSDTDGDGIGDNADMDDDNDGVFDWRDAFPHTPTSEFYQYSVTDNDNDGLPDSCGGCPEEDLDDDNDGIPDEADEDPGRSLKPRNFPVKIGADLPYSGFLAMSAQGDRIAIGSADESSELGGNVGAVRVFERRQNEWHQVGSVISGDEADARAGASIALSNDGNLLAVGYPGDSSTSGSKGLARVFRLTEGEWIQQGGDIIASLIATQQSGFGKALAFDDSADLLVVGNGVSSVPFLFSDDEWRALGTVLTHEDGPDMKIARERMVTGQGLSWYGSSYLWPSFHPSVWAELEGLGRLTKEGIQPANIAGTVSSIDLAYEGYSFDTGSNRASDYVYAAVGSEGEAHIYRYGYIGGNFTPRRLTVYQEKITNGVPWKYGTNIALDRAGEFVLLTGHGFTNETTGDELGRIDILNRTQNQVIASVVGQAGDQLGYPASGRSVEFNWTGDVFAVQTVSGSTRVFALEPRQDWLDTDQDGLPDLCDALCLAYGLTEDEDDDNDGVPDIQDAYPLIARGDRLDTDSDGAPDDCAALCNLLGMEADPDDDNDGVPDEQDFYPLIALGDRIDSDSDGAPDDCSVLCNLLGMEADPDDDNDGIEDLFDAFPFDPMETADSDNDGIGDNADQCVTSSSQTKVLANGCAFVERLMPILQARIDGENAIDWSGSALTMSGDGKSVAIGAFLNSDAGFYAGSTRIFKEADSAWIQLGADLDGSAVDDEFGKAVAMSDNGNIVAIGAPYNGAGYAEVYEFTSENEWIQRGERLVGEVAGDQFGGGDAFGSSVALSADGSILAVGAPYNSGANGAVSGHVRVFRWSGVSWDQLGVDIDGEAVGDFSGSSVALSADGFTLAVGADGNDGNGFSSGHVRIFVWSGSTWEQRGGDIDGDTAGDSAGTAVALSSDGFIVAFGAPKSDMNGVDSGEVQVYRWQQDAWSRVGMPIEGIAAGAEFGGALALSSDGFTLIAGGIGYDSPQADTGYVSIVKWDGTEWRSLVDLLPGEQGGDRAGAAVAVSTNGSRFAVGAPFNDGGGVNSGHVRVFELSLEQLQDRDEDGAPDRDDLFPSDPLESKDNDLDGVGDNADPDDDNDGTPDLDDALPFDATETIDTDGDGIGNNSDSDDDGDGIADTSDQFPLDATEWLDSDGDGLGNNKDPDDDNDGVNDAEDDLPLDPSDSVDTDSDGIGNAADTDDDGDSVPDTIDACPLTVRLNDSGLSYSEIEQSVSVLEGCPGIWVVVGDSLKQPTLVESSPLAMSRDGSVVAVGGSEVRVYELMDGVWMTRGSALISDEIFDAFGSSIDISADGSTLVVGAPESLVTGFPLGAVYVFDWNGTSWLRRSVLSDDQTRGFGRSVSLSDDGKRLAIGAPDIPEFESGQTQVFEWSGTDWNQMGSTISGEKVGDFAGSAVVLSGDGQSLAIGAPGNDGNGDNAGHVRVYRWSGTNWSLRGGDIDALPSDPLGFDSSAPGFNFGYSVALSVDGSTLVVGSSPGDMALSGDSLSDPSGIGESLSPFGSPVRVFHWNGSQWVQRGENGLVPALDNSGLAGGDLVAISDDGLIVAVGQGPATAARPVRLFIWNESSPIPRWEQLGNAIGFDVSQSIPAEDFVDTSTGGTVALSGDGERVAVMPVPDTFFAGTDATLSVYEIQPRLPDRDFDGVPDRNDVFPDDSNEAKDTDSDGTGDNTDSDDDGDGVEDAVDAFPLDASESIDTDGDGVGNNADTDDDNDGVSDEQELLDGTDPLDPSDFIAPYDDLNGYVYHWSNHSLLAGVTITRTLDGTEESETSDAVGRYSFATTEQAQYAIRAGLALSERDTNRTITSADALAALKIAVGLNPNSDPDGSGPLLPVPVSALQLIAADMNQDGRVTSGDALAILKIAVGLSDALLPSWALVEDSMPLWETHAKRSTVHDHTQAHTLVYPDQTQVNFAAVLVGDVNASWPADSGSAKLGHADFSAWARVSGAPLSHWGIRDTDGDGLSDQQEEALGTAIDKVDSDDDGVDDAQDLYPLDPDRSNDAPAGMSIPKARGESPLKSTRPVTLHPPVLLRGDMNDWGTELAFDASEDGSYTLQVILASGTYTFKIASDNWAVMDLGASSESERLIELGKPVDLAENASTPFIINVSKYSKFIFEINANSKLTVNEVN